LGELGAFGDLSESVGSRAGDDGFGSLLGIKFALDFHCRDQQKVKTLLNKLPASI
jgi:hypothetical protein